MADIEPRDPKVSGEPDKAATPGTADKPGVIDAGTGAAATGTVRTEGGAPVQERAIGPLGMSARGWLGTALAGLVGLLLGTLIGGLGDDEEARVLALQEQSAIIDEQRAGLVALDARIGGLGNELDARIADVGTRLDTTNDLIDAITAVLSQQVDDTNRGTRAVLAAIEAGAADGAGDVEASVAKLDATMEERLTAVAGALVAQGTVVEGLSARLDTLASDVGTATEGFETMTAEFETATDRLAIADDRFDLLADRVAALGDRIEALRTAPAPRVGTEDTGGSGLGAANEADAPDALGTDGAVSADGAVSTGAAIGGLVDALPTGDDPTGAGIGERLATALPDAGAPDDGSTATGAAIGEGLADTLPAGDDAASGTATGAGIADGLAKALPESSDEGVSSPETTPVPPRDAPDKVAMVPVGQSVTLGERSIAVAPGADGTATLTPDGYGPQSVPSGSALDFGDGCTVRVSSISEASVILVARGCEG